MNSGNFSILLRTRSFYSEFMVLGLANYRIAQENLVAVERDFFVFLMK